MFVNAAVATIQYDTLRICIAYICHHLIVIRWITVTFVVMEMVILFVDNVYVILDGIN